MFVVLDTNILLSSLRGARPKNDLRLLLAEARSGRLRVVVPVLVVEETINKRREAATTAERKLHQARSDLLALGASLDVTEFDSEQVVENLRKELMDLLGASKVDVAPLPSVSHKTIVRRALDRRKPFGSTDAGYRDALLWETVLEIARNSPDDGVFVSNNSADFAEEKANDKFSADLVHDLSAIGAEGRVRLVPTLGLFKQQFIAPDVIAADDLDRRLNTDSSLRDQLFAAVSRTLRAHVFDRDDISDRYQDSDVLNIPYGAEDVTVLGARVREVETPHSVWVLSAERSDGEVLLELEAEIDAEVELEVEFLLEGDPYDPSEPWHRERHHETREIATGRTLLIGAEASYRPSDDVLVDVHVHHVSI